MRRVIVSVVVIIAATVAWSARSGWLERRRLIVENEACALYSQWTYVGNVLIAHGCGNRYALLYDLASTRVSAVEFSAEESDIGLQSIAFGPKGELGILAHGGEAVILNRSLVEIGRFRGRVSARAIAWNRGAWEVADFYRITRYTGATGASKHPVEAWSPSGNYPASVREVGVRLHDGLWRWVYLKYRRNSWFSFLFGQRIEVEFFEISETGARRDLARVVTRAELNPNSFVTQPDGAEFQQSLANNNLMALFSSTHYEIDADMLTLRTRANHSLEFFETERFKVDATVPRECRVSAVYVSPDGWGREFNCRSGEIRSPMGFVAFDRGRLVTEDKAVMTRFRLPHAEFSDPEGNIVVVGPTQRRMQIYSPQLELVRDIRFEVSAEAARALWGSHRWKN